MQPETMLTIDPGKTTGFAFFKRGQKQPTNVGTIKEPDFNAWLKSITDPDLWVVEDYIIRPGTANEWNKGETLKLIGRIEYHVYTLGAKLVLQQPSIKPIGYQQGGMEYKKGKKGMHIYDAMAHGFFYMNKNDW